MADITAIVSSPSILALDILLLILANAAFFVFSTLRPWAFPPGPTGFPGLGNLLQIDIKFPFLTYGAWTKLYGKKTPLGFKKGAMSVVVLNSRLLVLELFEKRANVYNNRPWDYMRDTWVHQTDLRGAAISNSSPWLIRWRRQFNHHFGPRAVVTHRPVYEAESARLLVKLTENPTVRGKEIQKVVLRWLMSVPCIGVCGKRPDCLRNYGFEIEQFRQLNSDYSDLLVMQAYDFFPFLRYLPDFLGLAAWKKKARAVRNGILEYCNQFLNAAEEQRAALDAGKPIAWESMMAAMLREQREDGETMFSTTDIGNTACHVIAAGSGSSVAFFSVLLMTLAQYPEVQQRMRDEVLEASGDAPPRATDLASLKYLDAVWHEVLSL